MRRALILSLALIPALLSFAIAYLFQRGAIADFVWSGTYQIDAAGLFSRAGLAGSALIAFILLTFWWAEGRAEDTFQAERNMQEETRRRFFRRLDHELKNPLTIIKLGIANMRHTPEISSQQQASLDRIGQQAGRLQKLVEDMRWLSELEAPRLEQAPVSLAEILADAVALARAAYPDRAIDLAVQQAPWPLADISGDRDMLVVVFRNLLDNALKYSTPGDKVAVRAADDGQWAAVEVADTGIGIPDADQPSVFEELYRGSNVQAIAGSGLGLALAWRIIKLHKGSIRLRSRQGQGTVVTVRLKLPAPRD